MFNLLKLRRKLVRNIIKETKEKKIEWREAHKGYKGTKENTYITLNYRWNIFPYISLYMDSHLISEFYLSLFSYLTLLFSFHRDEEKLIQEYLSK